MNPGVAWALVASVGLTVLLQHVPYANILGRPLVWLSTLAHELGHGIAAMLVGAHFGDLTLYANGSGVTGWRGSPGAFGRAFIAAGGLVGPAVVAAICFACARSPVASRYLLIATGLCLCLSLVTVVGSLFTFVFVAGVAAGLLGTAWWLGEEASRVLCAFLGVQLSLSVFSRSDYLFTTVAQTGSGPMPSDTAQMAGALLLPAAFWGVCCGAFSVVVLVGGVWFALTGGRSLAVGEP